MKRTFLALVIAALASAAAAQTAPAAGNPAANTTASSQTPNRLPAGATIVAELSKSVDAKKAKPGDKVEAKTSMDLLSQGKVVIPRGTKIIGHVTEAKAHTKESPDSTLGIVFDRIAMKDGSELSMQAGIQAIARPIQVALPSESDSMGGDAPSGGPMPSAGGMGGGRAQVPSSYPSGDSSSPSDSAAPARSQVALSPASRGVVGIKGLELKGAGSAAVIRSPKDNVHLDTGTQLILKTE